MQHLPKKMERSIWWSNNIEQNPFTSNPCIIYSFNDLVSQREKKLCRGASFEKYSRSVLTITLFVIKESSGYMFSACVCRSCSSCQCDISNSALLLLWREMIPTFEFLMWSILVVGLSFFSFDFQWKFLRPLLCSLC